MRRKHMCAYSIYVIDNRHCSLTLFSGPQREPVALGNAIPAGAGSSWIHTQLCDPSNREVAGAQTRTDTHAEPGRQGRAGGGRSTPPPPSPPPPPPRGSLTCPAQPARHPARPAHLPRSRARAAPSAPGHSRAAAPSPAGQRRGGRAVPAGGGRGGTLGVVVRGRPRRCGSARRRLPAPPPPRSLQAGGLGGPAAPCGVSLPSFEPYRPPTARVLRWVWRGGWIKRASGGALLRVSSSIVTIYSIVMRAHDLFRGKIKSDSQVIAAFAELRLQEIYSLQQMCRKISGSHSTLADSLHTFSDRHK